MIEWWFQILITIFVIVSGIFSKLTMERLRTIDKQISAIYKEINDLKFKRKNERLCVMSPRGYKDDGGVYCPIHHAVRLKKEDKENE